MSSNSLKQSPQLMSSDEMEVVSREVYDVASADAQRLIEAIHKHRDINHQSVLEAYNLVFTRELNRLLQSQKVLGAVAIDKVSPDRVRLPVNGAPNEADLIQLAQRQLFLVLVAVAAQHEKVQEIKERRCEHGITLLRNLTDLLRELFGSLLGLVLLLAMFYGLGVATGVNLPGEVICRVRIAQCAGE
ncbi:hypothetical protein AM1_F0163 (plasmid) [Acaryochloris marina MBIC11017]|uniref:Uncharacterized protein n=2 Tax=Acaryochloris marina TaxID=155978 RepID=A8ZPV6_ACAM1|nr:hypothetical protein AM1_F0163 [Acaryochloris marina MBIC11017]